MAWKMVFHGMETQDRQPRIEITNAKLAGLEPRWARFRGFSLLFENPPDAPLYQALREGVAALAGDDLVVRHGLRLLPPHTYHVTVWDGVNDGNREQVAEAFRADWAAFLDSLPRPDFPDDLFGIIRDSELVRRADWNLRLRGGQIENWSHISLVARLVPANAGSDVALQRLIDARAELSRTHGARFGVTPHPEYTPHITLGYFANAELAAAAGDAVERWNQALMPRITGKTLAFQRILPSVFTDMASFGRKE